VTAGVRLVLQRVGRFEPVSISNGRSAHSGVRRRQQPQSVAAKIRESAHRREKRSSGKKRAASQTPARGVKPPVQFAGESGSGWHLRKGSSSRGASWAAVGHDFRCGSGADDSLKNFQLQRFSHERNVACSCTDQTKPASVRRLGGATPFPAKVHTLLKRQEAMSPRPLDRLTRRLTDSGGIGMGSSASPSLAKRLRWDAIGPEFHRARGPAALESATRGAFVASAAQRSAMAATFTWPLLRQAEPDAPLGNSRRKTAASTRRTL